MKKYLSCLVAAASYAATANADLYNQTIVHGLDHGVLYSLLTTGTTDNGMNPTNLFRINGSYTVDYNQVAGTVSLFGGPTNLTIQNASTLATVGTLRINGISLSGNNSNNDVLGFIDITVISNGNAAMNALTGGGSQSVRVDFIDKIYKADSGFNSFGLNAGVLTISLWGNEHVVTSNGYSANNWGLDWRSTGENVPVPAPGAALLGAIGLAAMKRFRRQVS